MADPLAQRLKGATLRKGPYVNTTDATQTTAARFVTSANKAYHVRAYIVATETADFDEVASYELAATFKNDGGTLSLVGSVTAVHTGESTSAWAATLDAASEDTYGTGTNTSNIRVRVTGASSTNISWMVALDVFEANRYFANYGAETDVP